MKNELAKRTIQSILSIERQYAKIQERKKELTERLLEEMKKKGIKKIDTPEFMITYIEPSERENFDQKVKGYPITDTLADQRANFRGRHGAAMGKTLRETCPTHHTKYK